MKGIIPADLFCVLTVRDGKPIGELGVALPKENADRRASIFNHVCRGTGCQAVVRKCKVTLC